MNSQVYVILGVIGLVLLIPYVIKYTVAYVIYRRTKKWLKEGPRVGDQVLFSSVAGPVLNTITKVRNDGLVELESVSSFGRSWKCEDPKNLIFLGREG